MTRPAVQRDAVAQLQQQVWQAPRVTGPVRGVVRLPGSKSLTNRALVLAALAGGPARITAPLRARDTQLMADGLRALGATISDEPVGSGSAGWLVTPGELAATPASVDCGLAGTVARFLPPVAALGGAPVRFDGDARMRERPMRGLLAALRTVGASVDADALPMTVTGPAAGGRVDIDAAASSQLVSGLLLAGPAMRHGIDVRHHGTPMPSADHVAMTVAMLRESGAEVETATDRWLVAPGRLRAVDRRIEPDLSSASAFLAAAAATAGEVTVPGWPHHTTQPGARLPELLARMGCTYTLGTEGLTLRGADRLVGLVADLRDAPEVAPTLVALATLAATPSRLTGIAHLRLQESDRLGVLAAQLGRLGARIEVLPDGLAISPAALHAGAGIALDPHADHRLAMAYAVVGLGVAGVGVLDVATTAKTVPGFAADWERLVTG